MRTDTLFDAVDASVAGTSTEVEFPMRSEWQLQVTKSGTDGDPRIIIEYSVDNTSWTPLCDPDTGDFFFLIDDTEVSIIDDRLQGFYYRIRREANGTTTGTLTAKLGYKTYP